MQKEIKHTWFFNQAPQEVWEYLTKPELIEQWLMKTDFQPIIGHKFRFICNNTAYCEVLEIEPFSKLSYSWQANSVNSNKPFDSKVVWTLAPKENGTELQLQHNGFTLLEDAVSHENGWNKCLDRMTKMLTNDKNANTNA